LVHQRSAGAVHTAAMAGRCMGRIAVGGLVAWHGMACHGGLVAWHGVAWHGGLMAWHGGLVAWHGMAAWWSRWWSRIRPSAAAVVTDPGRA
jgi:hypothetical protein